MRFRQLALITCDVCHELREPVVEHAIICKPCYEEMERELERRLSTPAPSSVFSRNDGRLW